MVVMRCLVGGIFFFRWVVYLNIVIFVCFVVMDFLIRFFFILISSRFWGFLYIFVLNLCFFFGFCVFLCEK